MTPVRFKDGLRRKNVVQKNISTNVNRKICENFNFTITNKEMLFRRIEDSEIEFQISRLKNDI